MEKSNPTVEGAGFLAVCQGGQIISKSSRMKGKTPCSWIQVTYWFLRGPVPSATFAWKIIDEKIDLYLKSYHLMGYDAFSPGEVDISVGVKRLIAMSRRTKFPFLLADFVEKKSNRPVFRQMLTKKVGGMRVGIIGLIFSSISSRRIKIDT